MNAYLESLTIREYYRSGTSFFTQYISKNIRLAEEFTVKSVEQRRRMANFWALTLYRLKKGKIITFTLSLPRIVFSAIRDARMSMTFTYNFFSKIR